MFAMLCFPLPLTFLGFFYISGSLHESVLQRLAEREGQKAAG